MYFRCTASTVPTCHRPLIEIDHFGERVIGCLDCNRWGKPGDDTLVQLLEDDLEALRAEMGASLKRKARTLTAAVGAAGMHQ
jgi:hypothetical protein